MHLVLRFFLEHISLKSRELKVITLVPIKKWQVIDVDWWRIGFLQFNIGIRIISDDILSDLQTCAHSNHTIWPGYPEIPEGINM